MDKKLPLPFQILDGSEWTRVIAFARDLNIPNADNQTDTALGIRLSNVLKAAGWTQFTSHDYDRACTVIREHYAAKLTAPPAMTEEEAFMLAEKCDELSTQLLIQKARLAYEHRHNKDAMSGFTVAWGYRARHMARAVEMFPDWLQEPQQRATSVNDCLILFLISSLDNQDANECYNYWREYTGRTFFEMYQYVQDLKARKRVKDHEQYPEHRRTTLRGLKKMQDTAKGERQEVIQGVINTVREKL